MKNAMLIYLLAGCLYLFSCTSGKDYPIAMKQAMSCMDARPDSALALLETLATACPMPLRRHKCIIVCLL